MKPERCPIVPVMARWLSARVIALVLMPVVVVVLLPLVLLAAA